MGTVNEQIVRLMRDITNETDVEINLKELKIVLTALGEEQLKDSIVSVDIPVVFDCLNSSNREQILAACDILNLCLPCISSSTVCAQYQSSLIRALHHPEKDVKEMALREFIRVTRENQVFRILKEENLILSIVDCLCDKDLLVGVLAADLLTAVGLSGCGLSIMSRPKIVEYLLEKTEVDEIYKIRLFEVIMKIGEESEDKMKQMESVGIMKGLLSTLRSDDNLAIMATLQVITPMAITPHGLDFLARNEVLSLLTAQITSVEDNPLSILTYPGLAKFFGLLGQKCPQEFIDFCPEVLHALFKGVDSSDLNILITSLEALGLVAYSSTGKVLLKKYEKYVKYAMNRCLDAITLTPTEWRVRALGALANLMHFDRLQQEPETLEIIADAEEIDRLTSKEAEEWFNYMGETALHSLFEMAKQPFPDIKSAALSVLKELAAHHWGQIKIYNHSGMMTFLMDRKDEPTLEGKLAKFAIVKIMYYSPTLNLVIKDKQEMDKLAEFVNQGANYTPPVLHVAVEGVE